jgi:hypothetical protein
MHRKSLPEIPSCIEEAAGHLGLRGGDGEGVIKGVDSGEAWLKGLLKEGITITETSSI